MSLVLSLVLLFLVVLTLALIAIHGHRCPYCAAPDARPVGDVPNVPKAYVDERIAEQAFHAATLPEARN